MFRTGGTAEGITSGLAPRQGYADGLSDDLRKKKISDILSGDTTLGEAQDLSRALAYKPRGTNIYDFMTEMGLDLVSRPRAGNIFQQLATSAKDPYQRFMERKQSAAEQAYGSESSMFKTLIEAGASASGEKSYAHRDKAAMVRENMNDQYEIYDKLDALDPEAEGYEGQRENLLQELRTLKELISSDEFADAQLKYWGDDRNSRKLDSWILKELEKTLGVPFDEENVDHVNAFNKRREEIMNDIRLGISPTFNFAKGGRVGYQIGGDVMPGAMPMNQAAMPTDQGPSPKDMGAITYEELRARLPQEVSDDIVRLLANSAEALEDFAMIQTEQDINTFNKKYGVTLVLPAEG
jgi:hypothetical protein